MRYRAKTTSGESPPLPEVILVLRFLNPAASNERVLAKYILPFFKISARVSIVRFLLLPFAGKSNFYLQQCQTNVHTPISQVHHHKPPSFLHLN